MPRKIRNGGTITLRGSVACGASDATSVVLGAEQVASVALVSPFDNITLLGVEVTQQVGGTGTGTFGITFAFGGTPANMSETTAVTFIDADAVAGTVHGHVSGLNVRLPIGQQLKITTVKSGTVSGNATLSLDFIFGISA